MTILKEYDKNVYVPFTGVEEVEPYFSHTIRLNNLIYTVVGAKLGSSCVWVELVNDYGDSIIISSVDLFNYIKGKPFGRLLYEKI